MTISHVTDYAITDIGGGVARAVTNSSVQVGDLLLAAAQSVDPVAITLPSGWAHVTGSPTAGLAPAWVAWKFATAGDISANIDFSDGAGSVVAVGRLSVFRSDAAQGFTDPPWSEIDTQNADINSWATIGGVTGAHDGAMGYVVEVCEASTVAFEEYEIAGWNVIYNSTGGASSSVRTEIRYKPLDADEYSGYARYRVTLGGIPQTREHSQWMLALSEVQDEPAMPPRITNLTPKPGSDLGATWQAARFTPITFDVDPSGGADVVWIEVWVKYRNASQPAVVYDGAQFFDPFTTRSSKSFDSGVTSFSILPAAGWLTTVERLVIRAWNDDGEVNGMIAYFADSAQVELGSAALTIDVPAPSDLQQGDVLVVGIGLGDGNTVSAVPDGWVEDDNSPVAATNGGTTYRLAVYRRVIDGDPNDEPAEYTWATTASKAMAAAIVVVRDSNPDDPVDASAAASTADTVTTTSHVAPSVTTSKAERHLVHVYYAAAGTSFTPSVNTTEREDAASASNTVMIATGDVGAAGATPTRTATSAGAAHGCWMTIAFNPLIEREAT